MGKKNKYGKVEEKKPVVVDEFKVPESKQAELRNLDAVGAQLQRELGVLEINYLTQKTQFMRKFEENRKAYEALVRQIALDNGVDVQNTKDTWQFDFQNMTFKKAQG